jgi:hypothetical protein
VGISQIQTRCAECGLRLDRWSLCEACDGLRDDDYDDDWKDDWDWSDLDETDE